MIRRQKWLVLTLALVIALSAVAPFFAVHNPSTVNSSPRLSALLGEQILICSGDGFKWVKLTDLQSGKEKPAPHSEDKCPLCYVARHNVAVSAAPVTLAADDCPPAPASVRYNPVPIFPYYQSPLNSRAPPYSFIG